MLAQLQREQSTWEWQPTALVSILIAHAVWKTAYMYLMQAQKCRSNIETMQFKPYRLYQTHHDIEHRRLHNFAKPSQRLCALGCFPDWQSSRHAAACLKDV